MLPFHDPALRFRSAPTIETERLVLRGFERSDLAYFQSFFADEEASRYVGGPNGSEDVWRRMLAGSALWQLTGIGMWAVTRRNDDTPIGHVGFFDFMRECDPAIVGEPEMGWILAPAAHGQGIAKESCEAILQWFEEHFGKRPTWALISPGNEPSMRLAAKLGFVRQADGTYRQKPETFWLRTI